jgi:hypothetical protein
MSIAEAARLYSQLLPLIEDFLPEKTCRTLSLTPLLLTGFEAGFEVIPKFETRTRLARDMMTRETAQLVLRAARMELVVPRC